MWEGVRTVIRKAFKMKLNNGMLEEYEKRHREIWPEMIRLFKEAGARNYSIYADKETLELFGYVEVEDDKKWNAKNKTDIMQKWWDYMSDIMVVNPDNSPVALTLKEVFYME